MSFLVIFLIEIGEPPPYCKKSPFCMVVVLVLNSWDWVRPPPPLSLGQNPNFYRKFVLNAPLKSSSDDFQRFKWNKMLSGDIETILGFSRRRVNVICYFFFFKWFWSYIYQCHTGIGLLARTQDFWSQQLLCSAPPHNPSPPPTFDEAPALWGHLLDSAWLHSRRAEGIPHFSLWQWQVCIFLKRWLNRFNSFCQHWRQRHFFEKNWCCACHLCIAICGCSSELKGSFQGLIFYFTIYIRPPSSRGMTLWRQRDNGFAYKQ